MKEIVSNFYIKSPDSSKTWRFVKHPITVMQMHSIHFNKHHNCNLHTIFKSCSSNNNSDVDDEQKKSRKINLAKNDWNQQKTASYRHIVSTHILFFTFLLVSIWIIHFFFEKKNKLNRKRRQRLYQQVQDTHRKINIFNWSYCYLADSMGEKL